SRPSPHAVTLVDHGRPERSYVLLGRVVATQGMFGSRKSVLDELRRKAAALGADALMDLSYAKGSSPEQTENSPSELTRFSQSGEVSTSETWNADPKASIRLTISGLAIRFTDP